MGTAWEVQCGAGFGVLAQLPLPAVGLGAASLPLVVAYPLAKRYSPLAFFFQRAVASSLCDLANCPRSALAMPQLVLGVTFNWGALLGGVATLSAGSARLGLDHLPLLSGAPLGATAAAWQKDCVEPLLALTLPEAALSYWGAALPLYGGAICWTLVYDTLYAHQDKVDDARLALRSSALTLGDAGTKPALALASVGAVGGIALAGSAADLSWPFYVATSAGASFDG